MLSGRTASRRPAAALIAGMRGGAGPVMLPTLAEILELDAVRRGAPRVLAGAGLLDRPVRWVHAIEVPDAARLLHGGELVLTTGIALPAEPALQARYVAELARSE